MFMVFITMIGVFADALAFLEFKLISHKRPNTPTAMQGNHRQ